MSVEFIETLDRTFRVETVPGDEVPGCVRRTCRVEIVRGEPLTVEEYQQLTARWVAEMVAAGHVVHSWAGIPDRVSD